MIKMGTDIYLQWKGMTKNDQEKQYTGFSVKSGDVGYLRASIGMVRENHLLRQIFPDYWEGENKTPYDFAGNLDRVTVLGVAYFLNCLSGKEDFEMSETELKQQKIRESVLGLFKKVGVEVVEPKNQKGLGEFRFGVMWFNSVLDFFSVGIQLQQEGKKPYVYISW